MAERSLAGPDQYARRAQARTSPRRVRRARSSQGLGNADLGGGEQGIDLHITDADRELLAHTVDFVSFSYYLSVCETATAPRTTVRSKTA